MILWNAMLSGGKETSMSLISFDRDKCQRDGICISECPFNLILQGDDGYPEPRPAADRLCISCGHCVAVCPHEALSLEEMSPGDCTPLHKDLAIDTETVEQFLKSRRSIRVYRSKPVPREILGRLLDIARWAPSAKNEHPVNWLMIETPQEVCKLADLTVDWLRGTNNYPGIVSAWEQGKDMVLRSAPHLAIAHANVKSIKPETDCAIALTYFDLAAHAMGVGTCWAGIFMGAANAHQPLIETLALPKDHKVYGAMMLGFPKYRYFRIPQRRPAKVEWR